MTSRIESIITSLGFLVVLGTILLAAEWQAARFIASELAAQPSYRSSHTEQGR